MEYRSVSTKLPANELTLFKSFCEKKGITPASLIREMILRELKVPLPHYIAGRNIINYDKKNDTFSWNIKLDDDDVVEILNKISPSFLEDLCKKIKIVLDERNAFIHKYKNNSITVPSLILRGKKK